MISKFCLQIQLLRTVARAERIAVPERDEEAAVEGKRVFPRVSSSIGGTKAHSREAVQRHAVVCPFEALCLTDPGKHAVDALPSPPLKLGQVDAHQGQEAQTDAVPAQVTQSSQRIAFGLDSYVIAEEAGAGFEGEGGPDGLDGSDEWVGECLQESSEAGVVHEHHSVHEPHPVGGADLDHLPGLLHRHRHRLVHQHMLLRRGSSPHPLQMQSRGEGDVDRLDVGVVDDQLVGVVELARGGESAVPGEVPGLLDVSRGQGHQLAAPGQRDRPGVLPGDAGTPEDAEPHRSHVRRHAGRLLEHFNSLLNKTVSEQSLPRIRISSILSKNQKPLKKNVD